MSVLVKDMDMPSCCYECPMFSEWEFESCQLTGQDVTEWEKKKNPNCPLVEVNPTKSFAKNISVPSVCREDVVEYMSSTPTADVVEVIRCKDCKHLMIADGDDWSHFEGDMYCYPPNMSCDQCDGTDEYWLDVNPDGYCKWGERREDGEIH